MDVSKALITTVVTITLTGCASNLPQEAERIHSLSNTESCTFIKSGY